MVKFKVAKLKYWLMKKNQVLYSIATFLHLGITKRIYTTKKIALNNLFHIIYFVQLRFIVAQFIHNI